MMRICLLAVVIVRSCHLSVSEDGPVSPVPKKQQLSMLQKRERHEMITNKNNRNCHIDMATHVQEMLLQQLVISAHVVSAWALSGMQSTDNGKRAHLTLLGCQGPSSRSILPFRHTARSQRGETKTRTERPGRQEGRGEA